jgi:alpha-L-rhamnosidase
MPASAPADVTESGTPAEKAEGVAFVRREDARCVFAVGSGVYEFAAALE